MKNDTMNRNEATELELGDLEMVSGGFEYAKDSALPKVFIEWIESWFD